MHSLEEEGHIGEEGGRQHGEWEESTEEEEEMHLIGGERKGV